MSFRRIGTNSAKQVTVYFDGKPVTGLEGETLAAALLANGQTIFGRSFKYHRPRGLFAVGNAEPNALVSLVRNGYREPNLRATEIEIFDGMMAESQNRFPSLQYDVGAINGLAGKLFSAGFYYKTFMGPGVGPLHSTKFWMFCEKIIRRAAGLGRAGIVPDTDRYERMNAFCDVLVIGAGEAGVAAASTAAKAGLRVILADGSAPSGITIEGVQTLARTFVWGAYDGHTYAATERVADHKSSRTEGEPRQRYWIIRAKTAIHATGATERPIVFPGNDIPGIMLASMVGQLATRDALVPSGPVAIFTNNDSAYQTAADLAALGATVFAIIDVRAEVSDVAKSLAKLAGAQLHLGHAVTKTSGRKALTSIFVEPLEPSKRNNEPVEILCATLAVSGGFSPSIQLASQAGGRPQWDETLQAFMPPEPAPGYDFHSCGSAAGIFGSDQAKAHGEAIAAQAVAKLHGKKASAVPKIVSDPAYIPAPVLEVIGNAKSQKAFVDFQHDVTADDIRLAKREGYSSPEHMKRYTTLGMATEQGRNSAIPALAIMAAELGKTIPQTGTTRFRPPASGVALGTLAAERFGDLQPYRLTPMHDWHMQNGATMYAAGLWQRPMIYGHAGETVEQAYVREARAVRASVGIVDVSTLGKIDIQGPDAGAFLDRVYTNMFSSLAVGKARYGLMLRDDGLVMDDGTTWRLGETHFLMTTTTANAGKVMQHLEYCLDCLWPDLKVHLVSVTDQWAGAAVGGPDARRVLEACVTDTKVDTETLPFMGIVYGKIADHPIMICRLSFSGELAYEVYCGAGHGTDVWKALIQAGKSCNITPYGLEALGTLRIEKGHVTGAELDGRTTAHDLHLDWMLSKKKPFIGQALMNREGLTDESRLSLVGIISRNELPVSGGSHIVENASATNRANSLGHVTAMCFSPALGRYIALALVKNGTSRIGTSAYATAPVRGTHVPVDIVSHHMFDPEGKRMHV